MFYKPSVGRFKDSYIFWNDGRYYLFGMYSHVADKADYKNVWMAESDDGVHFKDVGPVIQAPFNVWAMSVIKIGDKFILNHGSFTRPGVQNVIRFWESKDLIHWIYRPERDLSPDSRWYHPDSRLDCMDVISVIKNGKTQYYGYATGPGGFLESDDGIHWNGLPQPMVEWDTASPPPTPKDEGGFEIGGCQEINGKYYLVGGWYNYMGFTGYGTYILIGDSPTGPFRPDLAAYRLCGNSKRWVALWARFCRTPRELLISNSFMYSGYSYETGETWLPPLKKVEVDRGGHLRLRYWKGNDAIKGESLNFDLNKCRKVYPGEPNEDCSCNLKENRLDFQAQPECGSLIRTNIPTTVVIIDDKFNFDKGIIVEGVILATCRDPRLVASSVGFYLEETQGAGTAILLHSYGRTEIGKLTLADPVEFDAEDVIGPGCAAPAGIMPHTPHTFRLFIRKNMFELYLDDMLVQTFNTTHVPGETGKIPQRIGFVVQNGQGVFENIKAWSMNMVQ